MNKEIQLKILDSGEQAFHDGTSADMAAAKGYPEVNFAAARNQQMSQVKAAWDAWVLDDRGPHMSVVNHFHTTKMDHLHT